MKKLLLHLSLFISLSVFGQNNYNENFDVAGSWGSTNPAAYLPTTYTNTSEPLNDQFSSNEALRATSDYRSAPYAWRIKNAANRYFRYECEETVSSFEVYMARWDNDPIPVVHIRYSTNTGTSYTNIDTIDGNYFSSDLTYELYSYTFTTPISPEESEKIYIEFLTVTGERMLYDDFLISFETGGVSNPSNFDAVTYSQTQIDLSWLQNENGDNVMVATNSSNSFGTPSGVYNVNDLVGTATVIYIGSSESFNHSGLVAGNHYYYRAWSVDGLNNYSPGVTDSAYTQFLEPDNHPTGLTAVSNGPVHITVSWTDSDADKYLIKGSAAGYSGIVAPVDGISQGDSLLVKNVNASVQSHQFTGLTPITTYYFKIFPYNGGGEASIYKTDGSVPEASATTGELMIDLIISEVTHPKVDPNSKFVEIMNTGTSAIDFSSVPLYLCRQANGTSWASLLLQGSLSPGDSYVIGNNNTNFSASFGFSADLYNSVVVNGNGNDGYFLYYGGNQASGYLFDSYGIIDEDGIGKAWEYTEKKAVRKRSVSAPNSTWTASEWVILPVFSYVEDMTPGLHKGEVSWQGTNSTNWNEKGTNWNSLHGYIPDASCLVTLPNVSNYPIVTGHTAVHEVQIHSGSTLSIQSAGSLLIVGP